MCVVYDALQYGTRSLDVGCCAREPTQPGLAIRANCYQLPALERPLIAFPKAQDEAL
jgi:hypothetical protein